MRRTVFVCLACLAAGLAVAGEAAKPKEPPVKFEQLEVWAERIVYNGGTGKFAFTGNVTVLKGDMRVDCESMEGLVEAKTRKIAKVTAAGKVRMVTVGELKRSNPEVRPAVGPVPEDAWRATCGKADYDLKAGRLVMSGKTGAARPRLWRGKGYGEADMIVFVPESGLYELIGDPVIRGEVPTGPVGKKPATKQAPR